MTKVLTLLLAFFLSAAASAQQATISRNSNLRSGPSADSKILDSLKAGTSVTVISKFPRLGYVRVQTQQNGETGWVWQANIQEAQATGPVSTAGTPPTAPGSRVGDAAIYPIARLTPGKEDPTVTQDNIAKNICNKAWSTESVRPAESVTNKIKVETMKTYGFTDAANHYELDHLLSLQNGGCPDCVENLWPEAYGDQKHPMTQNQRAAWNKSNPGSTAILPGSLEKDLVENHVHDEICFNVPNPKLSSYSKKFPPTISVTLKRGQEILATDWYACYQNIMNGNKPCQ
jgi:uncharacterized protein YraI